MGDSSGMEMTEVLTRGQVARQLGLSPEYVGYLAVTGRLRFTATPLGRLYDARSVEEYAQSRTKREQEPTS